MTASTPAILRRTLTYSLSVLLSATIGLAGCHSVDTVKRTALQAALSHGGHHGPISVDGERVDPNTEIRFYNHHGGRTRWIAAKTLRVNRDGVSLPKGGGFIPWNDVSQAEVKNLSGARVLAGTVAVVAVVAVVAALVASASKGGSKFSKGKGGGGHAPRGRVIRTRLWVPRPHPSIAARVAIGIAQSVASARVDSPPPPPLADDDESVPPPPADTDGGAATSSAGPTAVQASGETPTPVPTKLAKVELPAHGARIQARPAPLQPLFASSAARRSSFRLLASAETGMDLRDATFVTSGINIGFRLYDIFEMSAGLRHVYANAGLRSSLENAYLGVGRIGINAGLDPRRWVSIPFQLELGGGHAIGFHGRLVFGLRVRLWEGLFAAIYPFNPTYDVYSDSIGKSSGFHFPTTLEVGFTF